MRVSFGSRVFQNPKTKTHDELTLDTTETINGHIMVAGASGTGKTHQLRRIINDLARQDPEVRFHILDVHGDLNIQEASTCPFTESSPYGVNPLKIDPDPDMGGVRRRARGFIAAMNRTSTKLGSKQESALYNLIVDLCHIMGFRFDDPQTWSVRYDPRRNPSSPKRQPTLADLRMYAETRLKQHATGAGSAALKELEELQKEVKKLRTAVDNADDAKIDKQKVKAKTRYNDFVDKMETGDELPDYIKYVGRDVLQSVYERLRNLENAGVFRPYKPDFDRKAPAWRYEISALPRDEQSLFIDFVVGELFAVARRSGEADRPKTYIVLDEAHAFLSDEADHILNVVIKEGRKFGVGLILASQSFGDFPDDVIANTATKAILGIDDAFQEKMARKLGIEQKRLRYIKPKETALVQTKRSGNTDNQYVEVKLPG